jgi:hypothetical protein
MNLSLKVFGTARIAEATFNGNPVLFQWPEWKGGVQAGITS